MKTIKIVEQTLKQNNIKYEISDFEPTGEKDCCIVLLDKFDNKTITFAQYTGTKNLCKIYYDENINTVSDGEAKDIYKILAKTINTEETIKNIIFENMKQSIKIEKENNELYYFRTNQKAFCKTKTKTQIGNNISYFGKTFYDKNYEETEFFKQFSDHWNKLEEVLEVNNTNFNRCVFNSLDFMLVGLTNSTFKNCKFENVNFLHSNFKNITLIDCTFKNCMIECCKMEINPKSKNIEISSFNINELLYKEKL